MSTPKMQRFGLALLATILLAPAAFSGPMDLLMQDYNNRKYGDCLSKCQQLVRAGQGSDMVHYYMGLSYQGLSQVSTARAEYTYVLQNSRNPGLRANAQTALSNLERYSSSRTYEGNGNNFDRFSPANTRAVEVAQMRATQQKQEEAQAAQVIRSGGG